MVIGKNQEGYWTNKHVAAQLKDSVIPIFDFLHPGKQGLFLFDNSSNHGNYAEDALTSDLTKKDGGAKTNDKMRAGWYIKDGQRVEQIMQNAQGKQKGLVSILSERGLYRRGMSRDELCALLADQPDFKAQESCLSEITHGAGHEILFFPKYHCEFNWIERYWGATKKYCRKHCTYSMTTLPDTMEAAFSSVSIVEMRRFARKAYRYMDAYLGRNGQSLTPYQVEWAVKKYKHHRRINDSIFEEARLETRTKCVV
jgi:transposase